jgi:hypothetical protein
VAEIAAEHPRSLARPAAPGKRRERSGAALCSGIDKVTLVALLEPLQAPVDPGYARVLDRQRRTSPEGEGFDDPDVVDARTALAELDVPVL